MVRIMLAYASAKMPKDWTPWCLRGRAAHTASMSNPHSRVSAGVPSGGQFATTAHREPDIALGPETGPASDTSWPRIDREGYSTMSQQPKPGQSLAEKFPAVAAQWHPTKNDTLTPSRVKGGARQNVWWVCEHAHEWQAAVNTRTSRGRGCPVCSGQKTVAGVNDLATRFPKVAAQWHPTRNEDLAPDRISSGTANKVWWVCEHAHEWQGSVSGRTSAGYGCPVCAGLKTVTGVNDLVTRFPKVGAQWHPTRNEDLTPDRISGGARQKVWWVCGKSHEWQATVDNRTSKGTGCPVCWDHIAVTRSTTTSPR